MAFKIYEKIPLQKVLPFVGQDVLLTLGFNGYKEIRIGLRKNKHLLWLKGVNCVCCEVVGTFFCLEKQFQQGQNNSHKCSIGLYGIDQNSNIIKLTLDHIIPRALGGSGDLENLQLLCEPCNNIKGDKIISLEDLRILKQKITNPKIIELNVKSHAKFENHFTLEHKICN